MLMTDVTMDRTGLIYTAFFSTILQLMGEKGELLKHW